MKKDPSPVGPDRAAGRDEAGPDTVRMHDRTRLIYHLRVFDAETGQLLGHMTDINPDGMMLIGEHPVPVVKQYSLRMDLPRNVMIDRHLTFVAESRWCRRDSSGDFYGMGFRVVRISPEGLAVVNRLTRDFYQQEEDDEDVEGLTPRA